VSNSNGTFTSPSGRYEVSFFGKTLYLEGQDGHSCEILFSNITTAYLLQRSPDLSVLILLLAVPVHCGRYQHQHFVWNVRKSCIVHYNEKTNEDPRSHTTQQGGGSSVLGTIHHALNKGGGGGGGAPFLTLPDFLVMLFRNLALPSLELITTEEGPNADTFTSRAGLPYVRCCCTSDVAGTESNGFMYPLRNQCVFSGTPTIVILFRDIDSFWFAPTPAAEGDRTHAEEEDDDDASTFCLRIITHVPFRNVETSSWNDVEFRNVETSSWNDVEFRNIAGPDMGALTQFFRNKGLPCRASPLLPAHLLEAYFKV
jgi:hypothetical protein